MQVSHVLRAWKQILQGYAPSLSIEITRECPLRCPGCYAYGEHHLGGPATLRQLEDFKGEALVRGVMEIIGQARPLHVSLVGGDPLVRYRELEQIIPRITGQGIHVQVVTSAFRPLPLGWRDLERLTVVVSIDGLPAEHDVRRAPATYARILNNIAGGRITVHCTITAQMAGRPGYLEEFLRFWSEREEAQRVWFSIFTPQRGDQAAEILSQEQRRHVVADLMALKPKYPKLDMAHGALQQFLHPPASPGDCIFAKTTRSVSADLKTAITPCQFGGAPDCAQCGCIASMGLAAVGAYKVGGLVSAGSIFHLSHRIGAIFAGRRPALAAAPGLVQIGLAAQETDGAGG